MDEQQDSGERRRSPLELNADSVAALTSLGYAGIRAVATTGSTNADLMLQLQQRPAGLPDLSVLVADHQSAGRGRLDRQWEAPAGAALAVSIVLRPVDSRGLPLPTDTYPWFSLLAAVAWTEALENAAGLRVGIKWPNDLQVDGRKLAGILAQVYFPQDGNPPAVVLGTGVNIDLSEDELPVPTATSVDLAGGRMGDREDLLLAYLRVFSRLYRAFCNAGGDPDAGLHDTVGTASLRARWLHNSVTIGQRVRAHLPGDRELLGEAIRLDHEGSLIIRDHAGVEHAVAAGDVVHLRPIAEDA